MNVTSEMAIPYWILAFVTFIDILSIMFDNSIVSFNDIKHRLVRIKLSIIPKLIFVIIYAWFSIDVNLSPEAKALHGRNIIFIIMLFDFFIHSANIIDSNQELIKKYIIEKYYKIKYIIFYKR